MLGRAGLTIDEVTADKVTADEVTAETLDRKTTVEQPDRTPGSAEARRNNALREIDRHREAVSGVLLRQSIEEIGDADFRDVEGGRVTIGAEPRPGRVSGAPIAPTRDRAQGPGMRWEGSRGAKCHSSIAMQVNVPFLSFARPEVDAMLRKILWSYADAETLSGRGGYWPPSSSPVCALAAPMPSPGAL